MSKKVILGERRVNFLQIWLLKTVYYQNLNTRAVARDAVGEQAASVWWELAVALAHCC